MNFTGDLLHAIFSLIFVIGLILLTAWAFRWWQQNRSAVISNITKVKPPGTATPRLAVVATLPLDLKRKLLLIRRDDALHLLLCGEGQDIVIETQIPLEQPTHAAIINNPDSQAD